MSALDDVVVVLVRTQGPVNLGLCARACGNMGVGALRLVRPLCAIDCADARKFANHARDDLLAAPIYDDLPAALADCGLAVGTSARKRDADALRVFSPHELPGLLAERPSERVALVFGNEADGLSADELRCCQVGLHLATPGDYPSYNLSHAVAIACYQMAQARGAEAPSERPLAVPLAEREALERYWIGTLDRFRYFRRSSRDAWAPQFTELINRLQLSRYDAQLLRGMLAQFNYIAFGDKGHEMAESGRDPGGGNHEGHEEHEG